MESILSGSEFISFFRKLNDKETTNASRLRFETESSISEEMETESTPTKEGIQSVISDGENTADFNSLAFVSDMDTRESWKELRSWFRQKEKVEFWNVNKATLTSEGQVEADYHTGYFTSFEISSPSDGQVELSYSYVINEMAEGIDTLDQSQIDDLQSTLEYETMKATDSAGV